MPSSPKGGAARAATSTDLCGPPRGARPNGPTRGLFNAVNVNAHAKGGHFGHYENPEAYVGDVRETFRKVR
ncbi:hypothetical protein [Streptomyces sp. NPDC048385]|uniref:hypothetical protein n=1 Tax=Streptomyces sp. NPDC048385 TaxID=3155145 RepID=UPI0034336BC3